MKRKLMSSVVREWRSNVWLAVELLVVSVVVWYMVYFLWEKMSIKMEPMGIDVENCFKIETGYVPEGVAGHTEEDESEKTAAENILRLFERVKLLPGVEVAAMGRYSTPYSMNFMGFPYTTADREDTLMISNANTLEVSRDYVRVFGVRGENGETSEVLSRMLGEGKMLLTGNVNVVPVAELRKIDLNDYEAWGRITRKVNEGELEGALLSSRTIWNDEDVKEWRTGAQIVPIRRMEFEPAGATVLKPMDMTDANTVMGSDIFVRVRPEARESFRSDVMRESDNSLRSGNRYVRKVTAIEWIRERTQSENMEKIRYYVIVMAFMLVCVFLGLLGTFWFRTQQRVGEIAIRRVNGATRGDVFRRLVGEGLLLLTMVTPLAVGLDVVVASQPMLMEFAWLPFTWGRFAITCGAVFVLMGGMIVLGIAFPAMRAMRVNAAEVLKDE